MAQVLDRATRLIEVLSSEARDWTVAELAATTGLNPATCSRLLGQLVDLGWADQKKPRAGYRLGPRVQIIANYSPYKWPLIQKARPFMDGCSKELGQNMALSTLRGERRQVLFERRSWGEDVHRLLENDDSYGSAGGRVLLAALPLRRRRALVKNLGLPDEKVWPGVLSMAELLQELDTIRRQGYAVNVPIGPWIAVAVAFRGPDGDLACLDTYARKEHFNPHSLDVLRRWVAALENTLAEQERPQQRGRGS